MSDVVILTIIPALAQDEFNALIPLVSREKQERIRCFRFFRDAQNALLGDILVRTEICRITGLKNRELDFSKSEYGKPFLTSAPHIHYNISHTGHYVACAIAGEPVGIDIELIEPVKMELVEWFFAPDETAYILNAPQSQRFSEVWTKKESRIKWEGKGLSKPLPSFSVFDPAELENINYYEVFRNDDVTCHVCSSAGEQPSVRVMDTAALMRHIKISVT